MLLSLPVTASGFKFYQVQVHVDRLSGKVHAVPTCSTGTPADAALIILEMALRSCDVLVVPLHVHARVVSGVKRSCSGPSRWRPGRQRFTGRFVMVCMAYVLCYTRRWNGI